MNYGIETDDYDIKEQPFIVPIKQDWSLFTVEIVQKTQNVNTFSIPSVASIEWMC